MIKRHLEQAKRILEINSTCRNGNEALVGYLETLLNDYGFEANVQQAFHSLEEVSKRQYNLIGILGDPLVDRKTRRGLLLLSHLDTPEPGNLERWTESDRKPFSLKLIGDRAIGLGAADSKLDFLCKVSAARKFREKKLRKPVYIVGTCGEKQGLFGCRYLLQSLALNPEAVVVGKPTGLSMVSAQKTAASFVIVLNYQVVERGARGFNRRARLSAQGKTGYAAYDVDGKNVLNAMIWAIQTALQNGFEIKFTQLQGGEMGANIPESVVADAFLTSHQLEDFRRYVMSEISQIYPALEFKLEMGGVGDTGIRFLPDEIFQCLNAVSSGMAEVQKELSEVTSSEFDVPNSTLSITRVQQEPGRTQIFIDARVLPEVSPADFKARLDRKVRAVSARFPAINLQLKKQYEIPGFQSESNRDFPAFFQKVMQKADIPPKTSKVSFASEAGLFAEKGYDVVVFGPGTARGNMHSPNESVSMQQLDSAIIFYEKMIEEFCL